jgi:hypothetical protein
VPTPFWIAGKTAIVRGEHGVEFYAYPAGGNPFNTIGGIQAPTGVTVSFAKRLP